MTTMPFFSFDNINITAVAAAVPSEIVEVDSFKPQFGDELVERFKTLTGIQQFRRTAPHQTASDLGFAAAEEIIQKKNINRETIGALVFVAHSTDYRRPATACVLHKRLELSKECAAFDVSLGCSAFVYGIQIVCSLMANSDIERALLVVGETLTKMTYPKDKSVVMMFGDAGGAVLLEKKQGTNIQGLLRTDGTGYRAIIAPAGGFRNMHADTKPMMWDDGNERTLYNTYMNGTDVFNFSISDVPKAVKDFFQKTNTTVEDYDYYIMHQANYYIHKQLSKKLKMPLERMPVCLDHYGNTSSPAIPLTLCDRFGKSNEGAIKTLMCGFGVGLSWGVISATLDTGAIYPIIETDDVFTEGIINTPEDFKKKG